jgi:hypothetical protein
MSTPKMYVLVRSELSPSYRAVQGGHAVAQYAIEHPNAFRRWANGYLIYLETRFPSGIKETQDRLDRFKRDYSVFREPDLGGQPTALACLDTGEMFKSMRIV